MPSPRDAAAPTGGSSTELVPGDELSKLVPGDELSKNGMIADAGVGEVVDDIGHKLPELPAVTGSYYDSTGHLALRDEGGARSDQPAGSAKPDSDARSP